MTSEERRTLMVIEHRLCSDDPDLVRMFARLGGGSPLRPTPRLCSSVSVRPAPRVPWRWVFAALLWVACAGTLAAGVTLTLSGLILAGLLGLPVALWLSFAAPQPPGARGRAGAAGGPRSALGRR